MKKYILLFFLSISFFGIAQHQDKVDFIRGEVFIRPIPEEKAIDGSVIYSFEILKDVDSVFLNAKNMDFSSVRLNGKRVNYSNTGDILSIKNSFKEEKKYKLKLAYGCAPKQTVYFMGWDDNIAENEQIWTQGQGKYTSHWLPSFDDMEEKVEFDLKINVPKNFSVIANGRLINDGEWNNDSFTCIFDMQKPMSSYLLAFVIGNYEKQELKSKSGIPIENYYYPQDSLKVEPTYRYTKEIFDFLESEIDVPYPWQNYKQIPVRDFLYAGMENTGTTIFSDQYVIDSTAFIDKNYVNVNAHELAHQWFGNLVTEKSGDHHWLHEGFATYYAYLAEQHLFGDDHFYWKLYKTLQQLKNQVDRGEGQSLLDPKASSLTFYEKGAWALFMLRNEVGDKAFKKGITSYLKKFRFKNATVSDFLTEMESASENNLNDFRTDWLEATGLPYEKAMNQLAEKSPSVKSVLDMALDLKAAQSDDIDYVKYWNATNSIHLKKHILENYKRILPLEVLDQAFTSDTIPIRRTLLQGKDFKEMLPKEQLIMFLDDKSYITKETALFNLWQAYPEDRAAFLEATKEIIGLPNKNVRILWLTLAMLTEKYNGRLTKDYFDELSSYTGAEYSFEIRQNAFFYLTEAFGLNEASLRNLVDATNHHSWQFKKFARNLVDELVKDEDYKARFKVLANELNEAEIRYLKTKLN